VEPAEYDRDYSPDDMPTHEQWIVEMFEPIRLQ
jgi:hypothetical protein